MATSFPHQSPDQSLNRFKTAAKAQHGGKPEPEAMSKAVEPRSFVPMPGRS